MQTRETQNNFPGAKSYWHGTFEKRAPGASCSKARNVNPGLNFNPTFFFFCSKAFSRIILPIHFIASNHQIEDKKNETEFEF